MGAKKSLTGEEVDPEMKEQQEAQQKLAEAEALANQQNGSVKLYIFGSYWFSSYFVQPIKYIMSFSFFYI